MASIYRRAGSPYWWMRYTDPAGNWHRKSTKLRSDVPSQTRKAFALVEARKRQEVRRSSRAHERWDAWVPAFIEERYEDSPLTLACYRRRWHFLSVFLRLRSLQWPESVSFEHCLDYIRWRRLGDKTHAVRAACRTTALSEIKFLGLLIGQAVRLGLCSGNPCRRLGISNSAPKEKPEFNNEQIVLVWEALRTKPEWMRLQWQICLYTGCRASEASFPLSCADLDAGILHFPHAKGGKAFSVPIRPELRALLQSLKTEGRIQTVKLPKQASILWWEFFQEVLPTHCLHCTRVTFISRGIRAGVPETQMMKLVNHAGVTINRLYQRLSAADVRPSLDRIPLPALDQPTMPASPPIPE